MGKRRIIISERDNIAALFDDDQAVEFIIHRGDMLLGDVYLASVENILPSIDAAFVNVGGDKMGFLHSSDVPGKGDLKNRLQPKQQLVVQVMKEPTGHKGPRVTTNISLPGRFLVLMPESKGISISRKIEQASERSRLKSVVSLIKPPGVGVIIRTEADQQKESDIQEDFEILLERWQNIVATADTASPPTLLYRDQDLLYRVIREAVTDDVRELVVDTTFGQQRAQQLLQNWNMDKNIKVTLYNGNQSILIGMGVDKEIKQALQTKVPMPSGGYLYIQPTEALCVIDVNSGKFTSLQSQADTIRQTNLEATKEIARQLRLRNIGGMIIVDFIDMESRADKLTILEAFENELAPDKAKPQIGQLSDLGLVEMTRHRQGQALSEIFTKRCIACNGTGHAMEEFNWAPPMLDGDPRVNTRPGMMRNKLPIRQSRQQQVPRPAASVSANQQGVVAMRKVLEQGKGEPNKAAQPIVPGAVLQQAITPPTKEAPPNDGRNLDEFYKERISQKIGARLAQVVKLGCTPAGVNGILIRINPKSNDIFTLVNIMESAGPMPMSMGDEEDGEDGMGETPALPREAAAMPSHHPGAHRPPGLPPRREFAPQVARPQLPLSPPEPMTAAGFPQEPRPVAPLQQPIQTLELEVLDAPSLDTEDEEAKPRKGRPALRREEPREEVIEVEEALDEEESELEEKPKRRRGRPPKRVKSEETAEESSDDEAPDDDGSAPRRGRRPSPITASSES